jgi:hypothetical protein
LASVIDEVVVAAELQGVAVRVEVFSLGQLHQDFLNFLGQFDLLDKEFPELLFDFVTFLIRIRYGEAKSQVRLYCTAVAEESFDSFS